MSDVYNPIQSVGGVAIPCPSSYVWHDSDVSAPDAGRTEDGKMHKEMVANKIHLDLTWKAVTRANAATILAAFTSSEYFSVTYLDAKANDYITKTFYVGDRNAPMYNSRLGLWESITFNIIEQ